MFIPAGGYLLNTVEFGAGSDTFVAHGGWVGSWELWQQPFQLMQERWRCIGYDHRGSGASTAVPASITRDALVDDLFTVLDSFHVERCVLAGESLGVLTCCWPSRETLPGSPALSWLTVATGQAARTR